jgi:hypothetical protein
MLQSSWAAAARGDVPINGEALAQRLLMVG